MKIKRTISRGAFAILAAMLLMLVPAPPSSTIAAEDDVIFTIDNIRLNKGGTEIAQLQDGAVAVSADVTNHSEESYTPLLMAFACIGQSGAEDIDRFIIHDTDDNAATTFAAGESKRITFNVTVKDAANSFIKIVAAESLSSGKLLSEQTYYDPTWAVKLQSLTVAGAAVEDFDPDEMQRTIKLAAGVTFPLEIEATAAFDGAAVKVSSPASIEDTLTVEVSCGTLPVSTYVFDLMWQPRVEFTNYRTEGTIPTASEITVVDDFQGGQRWNNNNIAWEADSIPDYLKGTTYIRTNYLDNPTDAKDLNANIDNKLFTMTLTQSATVYLATWSTYVSGSCQRFVAGWESAGAQWMNNKQPVSLTTSDPRGQWKTVYLVKREFKVPEGGSVNIDFTVPGSSYNISMYSMFIDWADETEPTPTVTPTSTPDSGKGTVTFTNYRTEGTVPAENEMTVVENFSGGLRWNNRSDVSWKEDTIPEYLKGKTYIRTNYLDNPSDSPDLNADGSKRLFTMTLDKSATVYYVTWSTYAANSCQRMVNEWVSKGAEWLNNKEPVSFTTNGSGDQKTKVYLLKRTFEVPEGETLDIDFLVPASGYSVSMYSMFIDWADETEPTPTPTVTPTPTPDSGKGIVTFKNYAQEATYPAADNITVVENFSGGKRWNNSDIEWVTTSIPDYLKGTTYIRTNYLDNPSNSPDLNANIDNKLFTMTINKSATVYLATWSTYVSGSCQRFVAGWESAGAEWMNGKQPVSLTTNDSRDQLGRVYLVKRTFEVPEGETLDIDFTVPGSSYSIGMYSMFIDWADEEEPTPTPTVTPTPTPDSGKGTVTFTNYRTAGTIPTESQMTVVENFSGGLRWNNMDVQWDAATIPDYLKGTTYIRTNYADSPQSGDTTAAELNAVGTNRLFTMRLNKSATVYYATWSPNTWGTCQTMVSSWQSAGAEWVNNKQPISLTISGGDTRGQRKDVYLLKRTFEVPEGETLDIDFTVPGSSYNISMYSMFIDWNVETEPTPAPVIPTVTIKDYAQETTYPAADNITVVENFSGGLRWNNRDIIWNEDTIPEYLKGTTYIRTNYADNKDNAPELNANGGNKLFTMTINKSATIYYATWSTYVSGNCQKMVGDWKAAGATWINNGEVLEFTSNGADGMRKNCILLKREFEVPEGETLDIEFLVPGKDYGASMYSMFIDWADEAAANEPETQSLFRVSLGMPVYAAETGNADYAIKNGTAYVTGQGAGGRKILVEVFKPGTNAAERTPDDLLYYHVVPADETGGFEAAVPLSMADTTGKFPYTIYTQNETIFTKTETIDYDPSGDSSITVFSLGGKTGTINGNNISVTVDANTNVTGLIATFTAGRNAEVTVNGAVQISGQTRNNFTNPVVYTVTADDGTQTQYTVTVTKSGGVSGGGMSGGGGGASGGRGTGGASYTEVPNFSANQTIPNRNGVQLFADVDGSHWAYDYIDCLLAKKIVSGYEDGAFRPDSNITREEFVKIAVEAFAIVSDSSGAAFEDVQNGAWYEYYVQTAAGAGIVNGIDETHFGTGEMVTRQDLAVMIARVIEAENISIKAIENAPTFTDEADISGYAQEAVKKLAAAGILGGYADGSFNPNGIATRAEVCAILYRMINGR